MATTVAMIVGLCLGTLLGTEDTVTAMVPDNSAVVAYIQTRIPMDETVARRFLDRTEQIVLDLEAGLNAVADNSMPLVLRRQIAENLCSLYFHPDSRITVSARGSFLRRKIPEYLDNLLKLSEKCYIEIFFDPNFFYLGDFNMLNDGSIEMNVHVNQIFSRTTEMGGKRMSDVTEKIIQIKMAGNSRETLDVTISDVTARQSLSLGDAEFESLKSSWRALQHKPRR